MGAASCCVLMWNLNYECWVWGGRCVSSVSYLCCHSVWMITDASDDLSEQGSLEILSKCSWLDSLLLLSELYLSSSCYYSFLLLCSIIYFPLLQLSMTDVSYTNELQTKLVYKKYSGIYGITFCCCFSWRLCFILSHEIMSDPPVLGHLPLQSWCGPCGAEWTHNESVVLLGWRSPCYWRQKMTEKRNQLWFPVCSPSSPQLSISAQLMRKVRTQLSSVYRECKTFWVMFWTDRHILCCVLCSGAAAGRTKTSVEMENEHSHSKRGQTHHQQVPLQSHQE